MKLMRLGSRVRVGFHRLGFVLAAPLLVTALTLAVMQWREPTGPQTLGIPEGTMAWGFGDDLDQAGKQLMDEQRQAGFDTPDGMMIVGRPQGNVRHGDTDWIRWLLPDGREIGIISMESKRADEIAKDFLLAEKRQRRVFTDKTLPMKISGVRVTYLNLFDQFHLPNRRGYISSEIGRRPSQFCAQPLPPISSCMP